MNIKELGWPTLLALLLAFACALVAAFAPDPMFGAKLWPLSLAAVIALTVAVWTTRRWLLLLLLPFIVWPVWIVVLIVFSCSVLGDCP